MSNNNNEKITRTEHCSVDTTLRNVAKAYEIINAQKSLSQYLKPTANNSRQKVAL
jgi:DNA-binding IscR family transcriptional regulator